MSATVTGRVPASYWIVTALGLVWNGYGAFDYLMTRLRNMDFLTAAAGSPETAQEMLAMIDAMPWWAQMLWGLGVWSSVLGSVLMVARSRHAVPAFLVSLIAAVLSFAYQSTLTMPAALDTPAMQVMPAVILGVIALLWFYCRRCAARGTLR